MPKISTTKSRADKYEEMGEIEHILVRPDMYVGSKRPKKSIEYVADSVSTGT